MDSELHWYSLVNVQNGQSEETRDVNGGREMKEDREFYTYLWLQLAGALLEAMLVIVRSLPPSVAAHR